MRESIGAALRELKGPQRAGGEPCSRSSTSSASSWSSPRIRPRPSGAPCSTSCSGWPAACAIPRRTSRTRSPASSIRARLEREITSLWLTDRSRSARPEVADEVRTGLWYFDTTLWQTVPLLQDELERALADTYPTVKAPAPLDPVRLLDGRRPRRQPQRHARGHGRSADAASPPRAREIPGTRCANWRGCSRSPRASTTSRRNWSVKLLEPKEEADRRAPQARAARSLSGRALPPRSSPACARSCSPPTRSTSASWLLGQESKRRRRVAHHRPRPGARSHREQPFAANPQRAAGRGRTPPCCASRSRSSASASRGSTCASIPPSTRARWPTSSARSISRPITPR